MESNNGQQILSKIMNYSITPALVGAVILYSHFSIAATISHYGYTLDTDTDIVTGGGLEWLQFDETGGQSVSEAIGTYSDSGWSLATVENVLNLFYDFFGVSESPGFGDSLLEAHYDAIEGEDQPINHFIEIFGDTFATSGQGSHGGSDHFQSSSFQFGALNENGFYQWGLVHDDYNNGFSSDVMIGGMFKLDEGFLSANSTYGIALVRPQIVPIPTTAWLFASTLMALAGLARRR